MEMLAPLSIRNFNSKAPICASTSRSGGSVGTDSARQASFPNRWGVVMMIGS